MSSTKHKPKKVTTRKKTSTASKKRPMAPKKKTAKAPVRPKGVPAEAVFDIADNEWRAGSTRGSHRVGVWTWWRPDGTLVCRSSYDDAGKLHGVARRYHSDGSISMESRYVHGVRWGKTRHTRSRRGGSPEDGAMNQLPAHISEIAMAYIEGQVVVTAACNKLAQKEPVTVQAGWFENFGREIRKFEPGTAFMVIGTLTDIARRRFEVPILYYDGPAHEDHSVLRFSFHAPGEYQSDGPSWQDPSYGTVVSLKEAASKLILGVDAFELLGGRGRIPPDVGLKIEVDKKRFVVRAVKPNQAAAKAGLRVGDVIVSMNGKPTKTPGDYMRGRGELAENLRLQLGILRGKRRIDLEVTAADEAGRAP